jgi:AraC-like DNA-binding protein
MLKASFEIITPGKKESFVVRKFDKKGFAAPFHFHPELELTFITEGSGKRFVGNRMTGFEKSDLVLMGPNLPHCWKLSIPKNRAGSVVIHFSQDFLGKGFFETPEMAHVRKLIKRSEAGIEFGGKIRQQVGGQMNLLFDERNHFKKLMLFLEILNLLSTSKEYILLNKNNSVSVQTDDNRERINKVFAYIVENFHDEVFLNKAAAIIGMTPNAFCKFFKKMTRKTFMETVINYRINFATQQLTETDKSISDICFESGFRDVSHFYKTFSTRMKMSPLNYRKQFLNETMIIE